MHKAGFVNIVGNPNVGKSTLMNRLVGEKIWVNVDEVTGKSREAAKLEAHNRFIDIQIPLLQEETFGWEERGRLAMEEEEGYQVQNDILFYQERPALYFTLPVGDFVIFFPEDAHAPCIGNGGRHPVSGRRSRNHE